MILRRGRGSGSIGDGERVVTMSFPILCARALILSLSWSSLLSSRSTSSSRDNCIGLADAFVTGTRPSRASAGLARGGGGGAAFGIAGSVMPPPPPPSIMIGAVGKFPRRPGSVVVVSLSDASSSSSDGGGGGGGGGIRIEEGEGEVVEPGKMRVSEIKAELEMRGIDYTDCFDKESLVGRLEEARATGRANPEILDRFNRRKMEESFKGEKMEMKDDDMDRVVANDGTLPGGLTPDQFKKLASNPEIMTLLQSSKMQEAMQLMMTGGREELEGKLRDDPELRETVEKLNQVLGSIQ